MDISENAMWDVCSNCQPNKKNATAKNRIGWLICCLPCLRMVIRRIRVGWCPICIIQTHVYSHVMAYIPSTHTHERWLYIFLRALVLSFSLCRALFLFFGEKLHKHFFVRPPCQLNMVEKVWWRRAWPWYEIECWVVRNAFEKGALWRRLHWCTLLYTNCVRKKTKIVAPPSTRVPIMPLLFILYWLYFMRRRSRDIHWRTASRLLYAPQMSVLRLCDVVYVYFLQFYF